MARAWYVLHGGAQHGPYSDRALRALATRGQLLPTDQVWCADLPDWRKAESIPGLFAERSPPRETPPQAARAAGASPAASAERGAGRWRQPAAPRRLLLVAGLAGVVLLVGAGVLWFLVSGGKTSVAKDRLHHEGTTFVALDKDTDLRQLSLHAHPFETVRSVDERGNELPDGRVYLCAITDGWLFLWDDQGLPAEANLARDLKQVAAPDEVRLRDLQTGKIGVASRIGSDDKARRYLATRRRGQTITVAAVGPLGDEAAREQARRTLARVVERPLSINQAEGVLDLVQSLGGQAEPPVLDKLVALARQSVADITQANARYRPAPTRVQGLRATAAATAYLYSGFARAEPLLSMPEALGPLNVLRRKHHLQLPPQLASQLLALGRKRPKDLEALYLPTIQAADAAVYKEALVFLLQHGEPLTQGAAADALATERLADPKVIKLLARVADTMQDAKRAGDALSARERVRAALRRLEGEQQAAKTQAMRGKAVEWSQVKLPANPQVFRSPKEVLAFAEADLDAAARGAQGERRTLAQWLQEDLFGHKLELESHYVSAGGYANSGPTLATGQMVYFARCLEVRLPFEALANGRLLVEEVAGKKVLLRIERCYFLGDKYEYLRNLPVAKGVRGPIRVVGVIMPTEVKVGANEILVKCDLGDCAVRD